MTALFDFAASVRSLLEAVHPLGPDDDPIVLPGKGDTPPVLLVRSLAGSEPRAFAPSPSGGVRRLLPWQDPRLPGARWLAGGRLPQLLRERPDRLGATRIRAYRPGRRLVLSIARCGLPTLYLKLFTASGHRRAVDRLAALGSTPAGLGLCLPERSVPEAAALCFTEVPGRSLHEVLRQGGEVPVETLLGALQAARRVTVRGDLPRVGLPEARRAAATMVQHAVALLPELGELHAHLQAWHPEPTTERTWQHGDLHDKQVFLADRTVHWIDLDGTAVGDGLHDAINLSEHLGLRSLQAPSATAGERLGTELVRALAAHLGATPQTIAAWRAVVRARLAGVYGLRPRWHDLARRLAREASEVLVRLS